MRNLFKVYVYEYLCVKKILIDQMIYSNEKNTVSFFLIMYIESIARW